MNMAAAAGWMGRRGSGYACSGQTGRGLRRLIYSQLPVGEAPIPRAKSVMEDTQHALDRSLKSSNGNYVFTPERDDSNIVAIWEKGDRTEKREWKTAPLPIKVNWEEGCSPPDMKVRCLRE